MTTPTQHTNPDGTVVTIHLGDEATIGNGAVIGNWAWIGNGARIGDEAVIGDRARIGDEARIGDWAWIGNGARIGDEARIGDRARIGDEARIGDRVVLSTPRQVLNVGPIGREHRYVVLMVPDEGAPFVNVGCWTGTIDGLMPEVERRCAGRPELIADYAEVHALITARAARLLAERVAA